MALSRKLTAIDEQISCDPLYLAKVNPSHLFTFSTDWFITYCLLITQYIVHSQAGRERQRFDFDDFDSVPQKFNI